jgi:sulfopyruvate decarboxylase subunit beta
MSEEKVVEILKEQGVEFVVSLPCDRTKDLCSLLETQFRYITVPREEDGIGICSGMYLSGRRCILQMQSSGLGNSLNAIMTLPELYGLALPILASWRGYYLEKIPAQIPFNAKIPELLTLYGISHTIIAEPKDIYRIADAIDDAYQNNRVHVVLVSPKIWDGEQPVITPLHPDRCRTVLLSYHKEIVSPVMQRADAIETVAKLLTDELVVSNIGVPSKELHAACDRDGNFYMLGSYTQATPIGLGLAIGSKKDVVVLDGDGSLLGSSVLSVVAAEKPNNLTIICLDNGAFGSTGNQCTPAATTVDLELVAQAYGIKNTWKVHTFEELYHGFKCRERSGTEFIHVILKPGNTQAQNITITPTEIRDRFMIFSIGK